MLGIRKLQRGDTIIEVLFAVTVFSLIVVSAISLMNQGTAASQRSLELTQVRQEIDSQAEALRFMHDSYVQAYYAGINLASASGPAAEYAKVVAQAQDNYDNGIRAATKFGTQPCGTRPTGSIIVNPKTATLSTTATYKYPDVYAQLIYTGSNLTQSQGIWVEPIRSGSSADVNQQNTGYTDFHIRACWDGPGLKTPMNIGTIVRLYEPRG